MKNLNIKSKPAFTMLELIFVVVILGILAAVLIPRFDNNRLREAADQVVSHIRYTQHLAMMDDKFSTDNNEWYKERWQLHFGKSAATNQKFAYTIFTDNIGGSTGNPNAGEVARNPQDPSRLLTGGYTGEFDYATDKRVTKELNIGAKYGVTDVTFTAGCSMTGSPKRISFDYLGRPFKGDPSAYTSAYMDDRIIKSQCKIVLTSSDNNITIAVEPESGYAHILP